MAKGQSIHDLVDRLSAIYDESVDNLRRAVTAYVQERTPPDAEARLGGVFAYPELRVDYAGKIPRPAIGRAFARLTQPGTYASSIARPQLFRDYLVEQLEHLSRDYDSIISVGRSASEIPYPYVVEDSGIEIGDVGTAELSRFFPSNELMHIGDEVADGTWTSGTVRPLALFESGAILLYLAEKTGQLIPADPARRYETIQWLMFQIGGVGPMFGQVGFFHKFAGKEFEDKRPRDRYVGEAKRLLGVLEGRLTGRAWTMGDAFTIADIAIFPWLRNLVGFYGAGELVGIDGYPQVRRVLAAFVERPAVQAGLLIPNADGA
jgi:GST-like protein